MGGKGTYSTGKSPEYTYETVEIIDGVKRLEPINKKLQYKLPEESHSPNARYVVFNKDGVFQQLREYNENHEVTLEIGYHSEPSLGKGKILHVHLYHKPGVGNHRYSERRAISYSDAIYKKYQNLFKGVKLT